MKNALSAAAFVSGDVNSTINDDSLPARFEAMGAARDVAARVRSELPLHFSDPAGVYTNNIARMVEHFAQTYRTSGVLLAVTQTGKNTLAGEIDLLTAQTGGTRHPLMLDTNRGGVQALFYPHAEALKEDRQKLIDHAAHHAGEGLTVSLSAIEDTDNRSHIDLMLRRLNVIMGQLTNIDRTGVLQLLGEQRAKLGGLIATVQHYKTALTRELEEARINPESIKAQPQALANALNGIQAGLKEIIKIPGLPATHRQEIGQMLRQIENMPRIFPAIAPVLPFLDTKLFPALPTAIPAVIAAVPLNKLAEPSLRPSAQAGALAEKPVTARPRYTVINNPALLERLERRQTIEAPALATKEAPAQPSVKAAAAPSTARMNTAPVRTTPGLRVAARNPDAVRTPAPESRSRITLVRSNAAQRIMEKLPVKAAETSRTPQAAAATKPVHSNGKVATPAVSTEAIKPAQAAPAISAAAPTATETARPVAVETAKPVARAAVPQNVAASDIKNTAAPISTVPGTAAVPLAPIAATASTATPFTAATATAVALAVATATPIVQPVMNSIMDTAPLAAPLHFSIPSTQHAPADSNAALQTFNQPAMQAAVSEPAPQPVATHAQGHAITDTSQQPIAIAETRAPTIAGAFQPVEDPPPINHVEKLAEKLPEKLIEEKTEVKTVAATDTLPTDLIRQPSTQTEPQPQQTAEQIMRPAPPSSSEMSRMEEVKIGADSQLLQQGEIKITAPGAAQHESPKIDIGMGEQQNTQVALPSEPHARHAEPGSIEAKPFPVETARATEIPAAPQQIDKTAAPQATEARTTNEPAVKPLDAPPAENTMAEQPDKKPAKNQGFQKAAQSLCGKGDACDCAKAENAQVQNIQADAGFDFASADTPPTAPASPSQETKATITVQIKDAMASVCGKGDACDCAKAENAQVQNIQADAGFDFASANMPSADPATSNRNNPPTQHASFPGLAA